MCQVEEEYREPPLAPAPPSVCKTCVKCKDASAAVVVRAGDPYCRTCFKDYFIHKFRAMLGKNRVIFPGEKVLLAVSGGPSSSSMLRQVQEGLSQNAHKKLRFSPGIVYIDEGGAVGRSLEERLRTASELQAVFRSTGFPFHMVPLEQVLDVPPSVLVPAASSQPAASVYKAAVDGFLQAAGGRRPGAAVQQQDAAGLDVLEAHTASLQQLMDSATSLTARQELLSSLRQHLLVHTARSHGYSKLMLGDSCSRSAVKLLAAVCLGRGAQLAQDTGFSDSRYGDVVSVRPMRDYSAKEIAFYNHMFGVPSVLSPSLTTKTSDKSSIQQLTESFITRLQADFPSTVSTIYRTSEKLQTAGGSSGGTAGTDTCLLCVCVLDTSVGNATAFRSTLVSQCLSDSRAVPSGPDPVSAKQSRPCGGQQCGTRTCSAEDRTPDLKALLCYSCQRTLRDLVSSRPHQGPVETRSHPAPPGRGSKGLHTRVDAVTYMMASP
uniref:Cytoplasmic tRNA 2-thiolation protein 2 n=1 Tax=Salarias fasciatus TaxID=181472 RepID=A0A672GHC1_SALFA